MIDSFNANSTLITSAFGYLRLDRSVIWGSSVNTKVLLLNSTDKVFAASRPLLTRSTETVCQTFHTLALFVYYKHLFFLEQVLITLSQTERKDQRSFRCTMNNCWYLDDWRIIIMTMVYTYWTMNICGWTMCEEESKKVRKKEWVS
jgi:hypothetical protein